MDDRSSGRGRPVVLSEAAVRTPSRLAAVLMLSVLPACSDTGPLRPPDIRLGEDVCSVCGMAVSDGRYAAALVSRDAGRDEVRLLDDLGELSRCELPEHRRVALFVRDAETQAWLPAETAFYVKAESLRTPMGYGIAAFSTAERAERRRLELDGRLISFEELRSGLPTESGPASRGPG